MDDLINITFSSDTYSTLFILSSLLFWLTISLVGFVISARGLDDKKGGS